jgi:hypothetical protein
MTPSMPALRGRRGVDQVMDALRIESTDGREGALDPSRVISACQRVASAALGTAAIPVRIAGQPSRVQPRARGRFAAGVVTLYPRAFRDPLTLAYTLLHEIAHAAGKDETGAHHFSGRLLSETQHEHHQRSRRKRAVDEEGGRLCGSGQDGSSS